MPVSENPFALSSTWDLVAPGYAANNIHHFERYAAEALDLAAIAADDRVLDFAAGPGSLSFLAAKRAAHVDAVDFSPAMIEALERRLAASNASNLTSHIGDGQALSFPDSAFTAAFSMFGLIFFPDRGAGFRELHRVLAPGGRCVVSTWHPMEKVEALSTVFEALWEKLPDLPRDREPVPLSDPDDIANEMSAAGFEVEISTSSHKLTADSAEEFWAGLRQAFAPIVLLENDMGTEAFEPIAQHIEKRLKEHLAGRAIAIEMPAWLALGKRP